MSNEEILMKLQQIERNYAQRKEEHECMQKETVSTLSDSVKRVSNTNWVVIGLLVTIIGSIGGMWVFTSTIRVEQERSNSKTREVAADLISELKIVNYRLTKIEEHIKTK